MDYFTVFQLSIIDNYILTIPKHGITNAKVECI